MSTVESIARPRRNGERRRAPTASISKESPAITGVVEMVIRSEERFSRNAETDLVCRLLLEKKKEQAVRQQPRQPPRAPRARFCHLHLPAMPLPAPSVLVARFFF